MAAERRQKPDRQGRRGERAIDTLSLFDPLSLMIGLLSRLLKRREPHLSLLRARIACSPAAMDQALFHLKPFYGDDLIRLACGFLPTERPYRCATFGVAHGDDVTLFDDTVDVHRNGEYVMQHLPDRHHFV